MNTKRITITSGITAALALSLCACGSSPTATPATHVATHHTTGTRTGHTQMTIPTTVPVTTTTVPAPVPTTVPTTQPVYVPPATTPPPVYVPPTTTPVSSNPATWGNPTSDSIASCSSSNISVSISYPNGQSQVVSNSWSGSFYTMETDGSGHGLPEWVSTSTSAASCFLVPAGGGSPIATVPFS